MMHELLMPVDIKADAGEDERESRTAKAGGLRLFQGIEKEELLIMGVLILLIIEEADTELILALAFLLLAGA
ncbi:MAG: hypothetical protein IJG50_03895 [Clostridia bacterium]|nr:hypothetical protein [Clostridia bacterium]